MSLPDIRLRYFAYLWENFISWFVCLSKPSLLAISVSFWFWQSNLITHYRSRQTIFSLRLSKVIPNCIISSFGMMLSEKKTNGHDAAVTGKWTNKYLKQRPTQRRRPKAPPGILPGTSPRRCRTRPPSGLRSTVTF